MESLQPNSNKQGDFERFEKIKSLNEVPLHQRDKSEKNEVLGETFIFFRDFLKQQGYKEFENSTEAYSSLPNQKIIVRREDPRKIFQLFSNGKGYQIEFEKERYENCVVWNPHTDSSRNIYNAFMEGVTNMNGLVSVLGFTPDNQNDLISMNSSLPQNHTVDRSGVRSYRGSVTKEAVKFITLRVPGHLLPEEYLTDDEIDAVDTYHEDVARLGKGKPVMVFRTYISS